jgi:Na+/proline symporter
MFFASRTVGSGIRLLAASIAIAVVFNWPLAWVIVASAAVAVAYTTYGGIKAVIWTDALQALIFIGGGIVAAVWLLDACADGWLETLTIAGEAGKLHVLTWDTNPNNEKCFWVLMISATFTNMAALGTDQDLTQRMLTCPDVRRGQRSLLFNAFAGLPIVCLFLLIGTLLAAYYGPGGAATLPQEVAENPRHIFPHFIATALPSGWGLKGLLIAGVFAAAMSSLDSALGAMSSTAVTDFYKPYLDRRPAAHQHTGEQRETHLLRVARVFSLLFGALLVGVALGFSTADELLWLALEWAGLLLGGMLGVFLLGVLTRQRGADFLNVVAMLSSVAILVALKVYQQQTDSVVIAWPWWVVIGTVWTFGVGACVRTP